MSDVAPNPALDAARAELADKMVPDAADVLEELSIPTALFFAEQICYALLQRFTLGAVDAQDQSKGVPEGIMRGVEGVAGACGMLDGALIVLGMLPDEAMPQ